MKHSTKRLLSIMICLIMVLAVLPVGAFAAGNTTVYCQAPDNWNVCKAYWWGSTGTNPGWPGVDMTQTEDGIWTYDVPSDATGLIFNNGSGTQTQNLTVPTDDKVMYVFANAYWTTYGKVEVVTEYFVAGSAGLCGVEWSPNAAANKLSDADDDGIYTITYSGIAAGSYEFKITNGSWAESWGKDGGEANFPLSVTEDDSTVEIRFNSETKLIEADVNGATPELPPEEPIGTVFYVAGGFNSWNEAADGYQMASVDDVVYTLTLSLEAGSHAFKVTNGTWTKSWGGDGADGNYELTLDAASNVTVSFDTATQTVTAEVKANTAPPTEGTLIAEGSATFANWDESFEGVTAEFIPAEDGIITVEISACEPGFYLDIWENGEWIEEYFGSGADTVSINVTKGKSYEVIISTIYVDGAMWDYTEGSITYKVTADVEAGEAGPGDNTDGPGNQGGATEFDPITIPAFYTTYIQPGQTVWYVYDNYQHMVNDGAYSMMLQVSSGAEYTVMFRGSELPVGEGNLVNYEMVDMVMQGSYLFSVTNNSAYEGFFCIEVRDPVKYILSEYALVLGDNVVAPDENYPNTLYEFTPTQTGVYTFTVSNGVIGDWGTVFNPTDNTENKTTTLQWTCTAEGQSALIGVAETFEAILTVERTGDYNAEQLPEWELYENTYGFDKELPENAELTKIDALDDKEDTFGVDKDGFCRYGSANGPLMVIDLSEFPINLEDAILNGNSRVYIYDDAGNMIARIDYRVALTAYLEAGLVPVTQELATMLRQLGDQHGWWLEGGFVFEEEAPENAETAWMHFASYIPGTELKAEDEGGNTGSNGNTGNSGSAGNSGNTGNSGSSGNQVESNPKTTDVSVLSAVVVMVLSGCGLAGLKKKEELF